MTTGPRRVRLVLALLVLTSLTLVTIDSRAGDGSALDGLRSATAAVVGPIQRGLASVVRPVGSALGGLGNIGKAGDRIEQLERDNEALRRELDGRRADGQRGEQLERLLRVSAAGQYPTVAAQVVAVGGSLGFEWTVTIDAGTADGVAPDMTVLNGDGLVGRVKSAGPYTATVLLAVDATSSVGVRREGAGQIGLAEGGGLGPLQLRLLDPQAEVARGDRIVTFGSPNGRPFVPGIPVGEVVDVQETPGGPERLADVAPYVDFAALDLVGVVVAPPRVDPRDVVLPPQPDPTSG